MFLNNSSRGEITISILVFLVQRRSLGRRYKKKEKKRAAAAAEKKKGNRKEEGEEEERTAGELLCVR